jgi:hypothetical protein
MFFAALPWKSSSVRVESPRGFIVSKRGALAKEE